VPLPLDDIQLLTIDRTNFIPAKESPEPYTRHLYPFDTLPLLESHIQPHFVIFNSGKKLRDWLRNTGNSETSREFISKFSYQITAISALHSAWTGDLPKAADSDPSYNASDDDDESSICEEKEDPRDKNFFQRMSGPLEASDRAHRSGRKARPVSGSQPQSPHRRKKGRKGGRKLSLKKISQVLSDHPPISELTQFSLDQQLGRGGLWTHDNIRRWAKLNIVHEKRNHGLTVASDLFALSRKS
jgi:hypothetical protein